MIHTHVATADDHNCTLTRALLLYEQRQAYGHQPAFVSVHEVQPHEHGPTLAPGRLLNERELLELLTALTGNGRMRYLPPHVLAASSAGITWWTPTSERPLFFHTRGFGATNPDPYLNETVNAQAYPMPPLVFIVKNDRLSLYALHHNERPTPNTPLYRAPFYNLFADASVCTGSMPRPTGITPDVTHDYEQAYFGSTFTHPNCAPLLNPNAWQGTYGEAWTAARELGHFPSDWLVDQNTTLAEALA